MGEAESRTRHAQDAAIHETNPEAKARWASAGLAAVEIPARRGAQRHLPKNAPAGWRVLISHTGVRAYRDTVAGRRASSLV